MEMEASEPESEAPAPEEGCAAIVVLPGSSLPVREASRILAPALAMPEPDVAARIRYGGGVLATGLARAQADELAAALDRIGVRAAVLAGGLGEPPRPIRVVGISLDPDEGGLALRRLNAPPVAAAWRDVRSVSCSALLLSGARPEGTRQAALLRAGGRVDTLLQRIEEMGARDLALEGSIYRGAPPSVLRFERRNFDYSGLGERLAGSSWENFLILMDVLVERATDAWVPDPVRRFLADGDPAPILLVKKEEARNLDAWAVALVRAGLPYAG